MHPDIQLIRSAMLNVYSPTLKADTIISINHYRNYVKAYRNGYYDNQNSWDCGRQDAFGDKVHRMVFTMRSNILSYAILKGDIRRLKNILEGLD